MKKIILICGLALLCIVLAVGSTVAFNTTENTAVSVVTMGNIKISAAQDPPIQDLCVIPGKMYDSELTVTNTGSHPAFIRVEAVKAIQLAPDVDGIADPEVIKLAINQENWLESDGFFYYKDVLEPGETTEPMFTQVGFDAAAGNLYQGSTASLNFNVYATQTENNGEDPTEASGWPEINS